MKKHDNFELLLHAAAEEYMEKKAEEFSAIDMQNAFPESQHRLYTFEKKEN